MLVRLRLMIFFRSRKIPWPFFRLTLARGVLFPLSADYSVVCRVVCRLPDRHSHCLQTTWPWRRLSMTYCCAQRLWSLIYVTCRSCWFPDLVSLSCCAGEGCLGPEGWRHTYVMDMKHFANPSLSAAVAKCWFLGFVVWDRTFMCTVFTATLT